MWGLEVDLGPHGDIVRDELREPGTTGRQQEPRSTGPRVADGIAADDAVCRLRAPKQSTFGRTGGGRSSAPAMVTQHSLEHSRLGSDVRSRACDELDRRITMLFHLWPDRLSHEEEHELRRLWDERVRLARHGSILRSRRRLGAVQLTRGVDEPAAGPLESADSD